MYLICPPPFFFVINISELDCYPIYNQITAKRAPSHAENTFCQQNLGVCERETHFSVEFYQICFIQNLFHWKLASDKVNQPRKVVSLEQVTRDDRSWGFDYHIYLYRLSQYPIRLWNFFLKNLGFRKESSFKLTQISILGFIPMKSNRFPKKEKPQQPSILNNRQNHIFRGRRSLKNDLLSFPLKERDQTSMKRKSTICIDIYRIAENIVRTLKGSRRSMNHGSWK